MENEDLNIPTIMYYHIAHEFFLNLDVQVTRGFMEMVQKISLYT